MYRFSQNGKNCGKDDLSPSIKLRGFLTSLSFCVGPLRSREDGRGGPDGAVSGCVHQSGRVRCVQVRQPEEEQEYPRRPVLPNGRRESRADQNRPRLLVRHPHERPVGQLLDRVPEHRERRQRREPPALERQRLPLHPPRVEERQQ